MTDTIIPQNTFNILKYVTTVFDERSNKPFDERSNEQCNHLIAAVSTVQGITYHLCYHPTCVAAGNIHSMVII